MRASLRLRLARTTLLSVAILFPTVEGRGQDRSVGNGRVRATFGARGLTGVTDLIDGRTFAVTTDAFSIRIDGQSFSSAQLPLPVQRQAQSGVGYRYRAGDFDVDLLYEVRPGWRFVGKELRVTSRRARYHVDSVTVLQETFAEGPTGAFNPTSARPALGTLDYGTALRFADQHSLLLVVQNPFLQVALDGATATVRYAPDMDWESRDGPFRSDRAFIAPIRLSGERLPARMIPEWRASGDLAPGLDVAEIERFTSMVRAMMPYEPQRPLNVYVGWCANDYQIDVATAAGRAEYRRVFDAAAAAGAEYVLYAPSNSALARREESVDDWSWEHVLWLGLGQRIRRNEWDPRTSAIPASVSEMLGYAQRKQLKLLAYVYPVMPFAQNPNWLVPARNPKRQAANLGNRALQDWLIDEMVAFQKRTGIAGYSFDHTFLNLTGTSRYAQWAGWRRVMEELRRRVPGIVIDGRQAYHQYGPWSFLAGSYPHPTFNDEQPESFLPYPDLHFDRVSADRERYTAYRYRNYEFTPSELVPGFITHQTSRSDSTGEMPSVTTKDRGVVLTSYRARDWDYLGWRYSLLSSVAVAGWNNVLNMLPARDSAEYASYGASDRAWMQKWLAWTATNKELLRRTRTILGQPALGKIDGTAAIDGDHGFLFLFNPDAQRLTARVVLDTRIGVTTKGALILRELHPLEGRTHGKPGQGFWQRGDTVVVELDGGSAMALALTPAPTVIRSPLLFGATGTATLGGGTLAVRGVRGEPGTSTTLTVALPAGAAVKRAIVNGVEVPFAAVGTGTLSLDVHFAGTEFRQMHPVVRWDSTFAGGKVGGTFTIPRRIFEQLKARRAAWPIPWTVEDSVTTWLAPERLLLYAPFVGPDDTLDARLTIDGAPVELRRAYTAVRTVASTFVGFYTDLSRLEPDRAYRFELTLPPLTPGRFRGLYFENIEPEYTTSIEGRKP